MDEPMRAWTAHRMKFACCWALAFLALGCDAGSSPNPAELSKLPMPMMDGATPFIRPGPRQPPLEPAADTDLQPVEEVIGISVGDVHRAYWCFAMSSYDTKVINDLVGGIPVTVTFCDRTRCARAFTTKNRNEPLNVSLGGWSGKALIVQIDGRMYDQDAKDIPLEDVAVEKTTWGEWKERHPDGEIFTGRVVPAPESKPAE
ncbi:MAG: DUF3179 domain-containing protein [Planctomycetia bacterium]|nr:DUF3179 domain-containing protein [Planctomycetia bacterium]